jgi:hypothetical protein
VRTALLLLVLVSVVTRSPFSSNDDIEMIARKGVPIEGKAGVVMGIIEPDGAQRVAKASILRLAGRAVDSSR